MLSGRGPAGAALGARGCGMREGRIVLGAPAWRARRRACAPWPCRPPPRGCLVLRRADGVTGGAPSGRQPTAVVLRIC